MDISNYDLKQFKITIGKDGSLPNSIFELSDNEILAVHNAPHPFRITQFINTKLNWLKNRALYCFNITEHDSYRILHLLEILDTILYYHTVAEVVLNWSKERYTIGNYGRVDKKEESRIRINKYLIGVPIIAVEDYYDSLTELKLKSPIYIKLSPTEKQWVTNKTNFSIIKDLIYVKNFGEWESTGRFFQHLYCGTIDKGKFSGIHTIYPILQGAARIINITDNPNKNGIWRAQIELRDSRIKKDNKIKEWKSKDELSTFFPVHWDNLQLIEECLFAFENKIKVEEKNHSITWTGTTKSRVCVEIITDKQDKILTMYPDWNIESKLYDTTV